MCGIIVFPITLSGDARLEDIDNEYFCFLNTTDNLCALRCERCEKNVYDFSNQPNVQACCKHCLITIYYESYFIKRRNILIT